MSSKGSKNSHLRDHLSRIKQPSPLGTSIFVGIRALDPFLQYGILFNGLADPLIRRLGQVPLSLPPTTSSLPFGFPLHRVVLLAMAVGSSVRHIYWILGISQQEMPAVGGAFIGFFNTVSNSINDVLFATALTTTAVSSMQDDLTPTLVVGVAFYVVGMIAETGSEVQRRRFKDDPKNKGKPYTGGLFSLARHINYGGYALWRAGYALASGGWIWGSFVGSLAFFGFVTRGVPVLDLYCEERVR